ncbi:MAG: UvrD-helicase domain-containing protein [Gammaproteobacteria bacterium]|nr:UvrD-helicase domain-containing protein [Gammaproteobacteria bacterium]
MSIEAANPYINATVTASAGSGKTWMLVTRIVRLLLEGVEPGSILALTFTRKAAGEMQQRLAERLLQLAISDDATLDKLLEELGLLPGDDYRQRARAIYEFHQYCDFPVRTQTFHSFCQDILARFPLEADVPPGFDLLDNEALMVQQAKEALFNQAALNMEGKLAEDLQHLGDACDSLFNMQKALDSFLQHRSDWWAFTEHTDDPCGYATQHLQQQLDIDSNTDPLDSFFNTRNIDSLKTFAQLLARNNNATNLAFADTLAACFVDENFDRARFNIIYGCFFTTANAPRSRKDSKTLRKKLGDDDAERLLELNERLTERLLDTIDQINKQQTLQLNQLWYRCGNAYIQHYQQLKQELRLLDFTDLEWRTYQLLKHSDNAMWVQYKLDQRINHFLIDEFQDTNPTQWQLILPILEEMAASASERHRSIFLVGDEKQSIYSFRRAKPELQAQASNWLQQRLDARAFPLNKSWRSSPAIIECVNEVFSDEYYQRLLPGFSTHETHQQSLPGKVALLPLLQDEKPAKDDAEFISELRNPLYTPRAEEDSIFLQEGKNIARSIQSLIDNKIAIQHGDETRAIDYGDIYILLRKRSHVAYYEQALRQAGIPYLGTNKGTFLECLEIQDMEALLDSLITPFNNLTLAQVLKSPLFDASDNDLMMIAKHKTSKLWFERILDLQSQLDEAHPVHRAASCLQRWQSLTDKIPVHDLLDRIFSEANLLARYDAAAPDALKPRVQANLNRFLELALDLDSGRYPSLIHFLQHIRNLKTLNMNAPDEAPMETAQPRVKIMTIHASKGLEAPVVYLVDSVSTKKDKSSLSTLVDWPVDQLQPQCFHLIPSSKNRDTYSSALVEQQKYIEQREDGHLLYVALTRARQFLFVSGCKPDRTANLDWYTPVKRAIEKLGDNETEFCSGEIISADKPTTVDVDTIIEFDPALTKKLSNLPKVDSIIAPSRTTENSDYGSGDEDAKIRGIAIHRCLDLLSRPLPFSTANIKQMLCSELNIAGDTIEIKQWLDEAQSLIENPQLARVFSLDTNSKIFNECPVHYQKDNQLVYGIIDRLIVGPDEVLIIDYKTHQQANKNTLASLAKNYTQQMQLYAEAIGKAWPDKTINTALLFTHCATLYPLNIH